MTDEILFYEELSLNALPALQTQFYDGWVLRYTSGYGYTNRANSVNILYPSRLGICEKVAECERRYFAQGLPAIFKITDGADAAIDGYLDSRGYAVAAPTYLMAADMAAIQTGPGGRVRQTAADGCARQTAADGCAQHNASVGSVLKRSPGGRVLKSVPNGLVLKSEIDGEWMDAYFRLSNYTDANKITAARQVYANIRAGVHCGRIAIDGETAACGLCVSERGVAGLYNIVVDEKRRGMGYGKSICLSLMYAARQAGAGATYLQVVKDNRVAVELYKKLGYNSVYSYWYRVKPRGPEAQ